MAELRAMTLVTGTSSVISLNCSPCQTYTRFCGAALDCCESTILWGWSHSVTRFVSNTPSKWNKPTRGTYQLVIYSKKQEHIQIHKSILNIIPVLPHSLIFFRGRGHTPVSISLTTIPELDGGKFAGSTFWISVYRYLVTLVVRKRPKDCGIPWNPVDLREKSIHFFSSKNRGMIIRHVERSSSVRWARTGCGAKRGAWSASGGGRPSSVRAVVKPNCWQG